MSSHEFTSSNSFDRPTQVTFPYPGTVSFTIIGGGGGGGGKDVNSGLNGINGERVHGQFRVDQSTVIVFQTGAGGRPGSSDSTGVGGGNPGEGLIYGGAGGNPGSTGSSGGGGGGGAATFIMNKSQFDLLATGNTNVQFLAIAGGGGGGGGAGVSSNTDPGTISGYNTTIYGKNGESNTQDGGGGGGGGGGLLGGNGGTANPTGYDTIAYRGKSGLNGTAASVTNLGSVFNNSSTSNAGIGGIGGGIQYTTVYDTVPVYETRTERVLNPCTNDITQDEFAEYRLSTIHNNSSHFVNGVYLATRALPHPLFHRTQAVISKYQSVLNRPPELGGLAFWVNAYKVGDPGTDPLFDGSFERAAQQEISITGGVKYITGWCESNRTYSNQSVQVQVGTQQVPRTVATVIRAAAGTGGYVGIQYTPDDPNISTIYTKINGQMKKVPKLLYKRNNSWDNIKEAYVKVNGQWINIYTYVDPNTLIPSFTQLNVNKPELIETPPPYAIISCTGTTSGSGSNTATYALDFGSRYGICGISFDLYGANDEMEIVHNGITYTTGRRNGTGTLTFNRTLGTSRYAILHVNRNFSGSAWQFNIICPT